MARGYPAEDRKVRPAPDVVPGGGRDHPLPEFPPRRARLG